MTPARLVSLAIVIAVPVLPPAFAQVAAPSGQVPCVNEFLPLRKTAEERGIAIKTLMEKKAPRPEVCQAFKNFAVAEEKVVKFVETNNVWCGIPPDAVKKMKANHARTLQARNQICNAAALPGGGAPRPPSLSDALGTSRVPDASNTQTGRGTFDTLTGNPLTR
jgi:hypothetical protein